MCVQQFRKIFNVHRYSSRVLTVRGTSKHDVESYLDPDVFAPDPAELYDFDDSSTTKNLYSLNDLHDIMNSSEDEPLSGLNLRLRPRRRTTSLQSKNTKKCDSRIAQDKPKRTRTPSRAIPNKPDDLTNNADSLPLPQHLCPHCDRKFSSKQTVSKHARRIHLSDSKQDFFIACLFCNHTEAEANEIIRHMVDNHPNQYFACLDCQTRFSSTSELAEHKLNVCERQKPYRSKLRQKNTSVTKHTQKNLNIDERDDFQNDKEYIENRGFNGIVISCELKPSQTQIHDEADIEDNITTNLILPPSKSLANSTVIEKNAVIVLDDIQWNKRIPQNFSFHNTDADQILSRLGVVHRSPRTGETTRRDWFKTIDDSTQKFEKCFETSFYSKVASNVAENLAKCLDGSFNFNPDLENTIKTRRAKNSVVINTAEGFPILLAREQFSRNLFDSYMPRSIAPKHKWKWDSPESDKSVINADQVKRDSHTNNCIITLVSSLDIWTQLSMRKKFENKFNISHAVKKTEKQSIIDKELKEILESREIPTTSSTQIIKYANSPPPVRDGLDFPSYLGLAPSAPSYNLQPAVLSGEWVRPRCYVCCACGAQTRDSRALSSHISIQHPNAQVQHYEIVGEPLLNSDILKHLYVPPSQVFNRTRPLRGIRDCTKCQKSISLEDLHQHMLDCAGDTPAVRRKCRYRPFGVRRRRPRLPDNVMRRKIRKDLRNRHKQKNHLRSRQKIRSEVGDAETIRKMIADLPAKRHRVVVNPLNPTLRPRRKLDKQRSTLLMKHRSTDDSKSRKLRSVKDLNNSANSVNIPPHKEEENKMIPNQDDEDNKPLKPTRRPNDGKNTRHSDSIKRKTVLNRAKRKIQMKNINIVKLPDLDTVDANSSSNSPDEEFQKINAPKKIDVNNSQYSSRQHSGRGNYNRSSSNRSRNHRGNNDRGNFDRGNTNRGSHDRGNNNRENANQGNGNRGNSNTGHGARRNQDKDKTENDPPAEDDPLKHSKATAVGDAEVKNKDQQERNDCPQHLTTRQADFENEAADSRIDKPPLLCNQKVAIDLQKNISTKTRKGKGLNDCIEMLKMKNNKETTVDTGDGPIDLSAHGRAASETNFDFHPNVYEASGVADLKALQYIQQNTQQVPQTSFQTDDRHLAQPVTGSAIQTHTRTVIQPSGNIEASPVVETDVGLAVKIKGLPVVQADNRQAVHTDHLAIHKGDRPYVYKGDHSDVDTDNRRDVAADDHLAAFTTKPKTRSCHPDMRRAVQPVPTLQSEAQLFAHHIANLAANPAQHSVEHPLAQPDARALALHAAEHLGLQSVPHLAAHQSVHPVRHPIHPAMFSAIRPEFELSHYASLAGQAQLAAQYRGVNPMDSRFFRPFDPSPLERGLAYLQHNIAHDQAAHGLPSCQENQTKPSTPPKKTPVRRKSTRLTSRLNVPPDLPQNIFGLTPLEIIPPQKFPGPYSSKMISPDSDQTKKRKQHDIATDTLINQPDYSKSPKTAEYLHMLNLNMSGGQLIENKSYQQPVDTEPNARSTIESTILEDQRKIAERLLVIRTNCEQAAPLEYMPHAKHVIPDALIQAEQRFRVPSYPYPSYSDHIKYAEHRPLPENQTLHEMSQYPGMKSHVDKNMQQEPRPHSDSRTYTQQMPFQNQMPFPELRPLPRSLEQIAYEQRYLNQSLFPDQPQCLNIAIRQDLGKYPEQRQNSPQTSYPNQSLFPDNRTIAEKVVDQNELMKPPEHRPLTKRRLSKELKSVSERKLSTDQKTSNERRPSNDLLSIQEQNISKDVTKDLSLSVEQTPIEPRLPAKLRLSAERKASDERRLSAERKASDERRLSAERKASDESRLSAERKASDERRLSVERKASDEHRLSAERKASDERRLSAERKASDERRLSAERKASDERRLSAERKASDERRLSAERKASDERRLSAERKASDERRLSAERKASDERRLSAERKASDERRLSAERKASDERRLSAERKASDERRLSAERKASDERRLSAESKASDERRVSAERKKSDKSRLSAKRKASDERRLSAERKESDGRRLSDKRRLSAERKKSDERRLSAERKESDERRLSAERKESDERRLSAERKASDERLSAERKASDERRLSAERKASDERRLSAERKVSDERLSAERNASDERRVYAERKESNERRLSAERKASDKRRLSAERKESDERRLSAERKASDKRRLSAERKESDGRRLSDESRLSAERKKCNERRYSAERKVSNEGQLSDEHKLSDERRLPDERRLSNDSICLSAEQKPSVEYRPFLEPGPSVEHRSSNKYCRSIESQPSVEPAPSMERKPSVILPSVDSRATVVRAPSVESQPSIERRPIVERQLSTEQKPTVESRPSAGDPPSASSPHFADSPPSACSPPSAGSRPSVVQAPALGSRLSIEYRISVDQNSSVERHQFSTEEKPVVERPSSVDSRPSVVRAPSVESRPSTDSRSSVVRAPSVESRHSIDSRSSVVRAPSVESRHSIDSRSSVVRAPSVESRHSIDSRSSVVRAPSVESRHSIERAPSVESRISIDRRSSFERDPFCERRLSKELPHVNEHTVTSKEMLCEVKTPSTEKGILNKQWPAVNQQLLYEQSLQAQAQRAQFFQEQAQLLQSGGDQRLLNEQMSLNERRLSEHRSSTEQKPLIDQELIIQNNALLEEETLVQPTYTGLNPHIPAYIQTPMTNVYRSNGRPQNVQKQGYMPIPLDLSSQRSTNTPIPLAGTRWKPPTDSTVERNLGTELSFNKGVSWNPSTENKAENMIYGVRVIPSRDLAESQEYSNIMNDASRNLTCQHYQEISNTMNDPSRILTEREPFLYSNIMTNTHSHLHPEVLEKSTTNSDFVDNDISDNISNTADCTADDESFLDIMSTEDIKPEYSLDIKTELPASESRIIDNAENIQQLNSNVVLSNIMTASNPTLEADTALQIAKAAVSTNSDTCATGKQSDFATSSLNSESDAITSVYTLSNPVMATTVNKHESTLPVDTSLNACISVKELESVADTRTGAPFNYEGIQNNDELQMAPVIRNSHMQTTAFEDTTAVNRVDASTATTDPETARKIALLPPELADVLEDLPTEKRDILLDVLPQYVSTSRSSPRNHYDSNILNTSRQASTSEHMLVHENQNMTNMHGFIPSYQLLSNMQLCPPPFMGSFNMDENHPMSYLPSVYQAPPPPPPQFTMLPPPPPPPPILVAPPPPPPVKEETSQNNPPLQTQSTFIPPLPPNPPPPLFPLPAVIKTDKTDDEDEDVKPPIMDMKEEKDLENEDLSVDQFQPGPSAAPDIRNTNNESIVIDLTEETPPNNKDFVELADDYTKTVIPPQQFTHYHVAVVSTPNLKTISDKTSSLRAVRIKTASERNKSSAVNVSQTRLNTESEVTALSARPAIHKEIQQCIKALNEREIEKVRDSSKQIEQHEANTAVEKRPIIDQFQDSEEEDNKLLQWKISLAIQQAEITSTQQNNKNKAMSSKPTATVSPGSILRPENRTNNELLNPVALTEDILFKNDKDLIDNSILESRSVFASAPQQDSHVLDRSQNSAASQDYELIDGAQLPSKDNIEPKSYDKTASRTAVERLTPVHGTVSDDSDDDVSLAIIVKNRDQLKNNLQIDNFSDNKSANYKALEENVKEDIILKETTNNLNKDRTVEPNSYINDKIEIKQQLQQQQIILKPLAGDVTNEILQTNRTIKETEENQPTKTNNRKKSNGDPNDHKLIEIQTARYTNKEDVYKARNIITSDSIIDKGTSNSGEQLINKPYVIYDKRDQQTSSLKKVVEDGIKKSPISLKSKDKEMPELQKNKQKNISTCNLSTTSLNGDDKTTHAKSEIEIKTVSLKTVYQKPKEILAQTSIKESHPSQNTNIITKESTAVDETDNLKEIADKSINRVVIENKKSLDFEIDENNTTPLRRSRRRKSALGEDDITDEPGASIEQKTPLTKKQLIFSKLLLDEENHAEAEAHSTPEKDLSPVSIQTNDTSLKSSPTSPIIDVAAVPIQEKHDQGKRKRTKRKKSVQLRRLYKKKKSYEFSDKSEARYSQRVKKKSKIRLHSESCVTSEQIRRDSHTTINDKERFSVTENKSHRSPSANKDLETTTKKLNLQSGPTAINEKFNTSGDKRKVDDTATDDCSEITKTKKLKFLDKSKEDMELKHDMHVLKEKVPLSLEKRTACYMPVAARRTRSKSVIVKSSTADFYDPYDIDLDDMIEKPDSFRRKINVLDKNTQNLKIHNNSKSKTNIPTSIKTHALVKKSSKPSDYLVNYRNKIAARSKNNVTDSDDSTKSDVPLTKYIEDKEKKCVKPVSNKRNVKDTSSGRNGKQNVKSKRNSQEIKRNRRTLTTFNDINKSSTPNDAEELRSEKFMESFGFFSQRKPRKSNLLASKKISETFHIIANESDDAYFGSKKRTQKRSNQNESKKSIGGGDTTTRPRRRIAAKKVIKRIPIKKKVFVQPVPCFCRLCKKEFRRPDNFLRHQMTVLHVSKLSEIELKMRTIPIIEKPNYLIAYKRQLDRLKLLTKKFANGKHSKYAKIKLPTLDKILAKVNRKVRQQKLAQRGLSRDEALFIDCCQLLKSNKSELKQPPDPISFNAGPNHLSESTVKTFDLLEKPIKGDGDVDSITAKNILESDEVKNLEKDLISGLKEAANEGSLKTKIMYQRSVSDVGLDQIDDEKLDYSSSKVRENVEPYPVSHPSKTKKQPEVKEKMYPDIIESIDMFEDKFDKIKRKCRSQAAAAAAKQTQAVIEPSARFTCRKKAEKKKARRNSKKTQQSSQVLTKGALKGFDGIKVSIPTSDINMSAIVPSMTSPKKKKKLNTRKKERVAESSGKNDSQRHAGDGTTSQKEVDVYEFLDNEDAVFEFRPSTLMERFKSISYKDTPGTSKLNPGVDDADISRDSVSDGDDFVYMSDDYICSDNETENSLLSCELNNGKVGCELKKNSSPLKRKDAVEKNAVMGKIFKFNAVRSDKKSTKVKETEKPKANLDQLFDSLLEDEPNSSVLNNETESPKNDVFVTPKKHDHSSKYEKYSRTFSSRDECSSPTKSKSPSPKRHMSSPGEYDRSSFIDYGPSTSKTAAIDFGPSTSKKRDSISPKDFKDLSPQKYDTPLHEETQKYTKIKHSEPSHSKSDVIPIKKRDSKKEKSPSSKLDEGISTSYDYSADVFDQYDDTGVARQRARRKCTVGKQNVLAETWSSESEPDGIPPRPNSAESVVLTSRRKKGKKRDSHHGGARRANNRHISFKKQDLESRLSNFSRTTARVSDATASRAGRDSEEAVSVNPYDSPAPSTSSAHLSLPGPGPRPRARPTAYWSSDGDDEPEHVQQHGWIVGDSHKKLVTMLAHAKGRKGKTDDKRHFVE